MKFLINNLRLLLRRFPSVAIINVAGLAVAFAVTLVVARQVWYDVSYDCGYLRAGQIYISELDWGTGGGPMDGINQQIPRQWKEQIPQIKDYALMGRQIVTTWFRRADAAAGSDAAGDIRLMYASPGFLDVFTPTIVAGDASQALNVPGHCIISESTARAIFGADNPIGQTIVSERREELVLFKNESQLVVDAVCSDFPLNSSIANGVYTAQGEQGRGQFNSTGYFVIDPTDREQVLEQMNDTSKLAEMTGMGIENYKFYLTELSQFYMHGGAAGQGGAAGMVMYLLLVGAFVLLVAMINFVNLSMALAPARVRGINIHRILGIRLGSLRLALALESVLTALAAAIIGCAIVHWFAGSGFTGLFTAPMSLGSGGGVTAIVLVVFLLIAFGVGLHSARYASSFEVAIALKSSFALSRGGSRLRNGLIAVQFATAIFFICFAAAIKIQYDYMARYNPGYERENIVTFDAGISSIQADALANELKSNPNVLDVTSTMEMPGEVGSVSGSKVKDKPVSYHTWWVAPNFLDFFGIDATPGRLDAGFKFHIPEPYAAIMIFNRELLRKYDFTEAEITEMGIGIAPDINFESLHQPVKPMAFSILPEWKSVMPNVFVKISGKDVAATIEHIQRTWRAMADGNGGAVDVVFLDDHLDRLYQREQGMSRLIGLLGLVAVAIAIMGVYALTAFNTRYKTREIAIRRVNGATVGGVMAMLGRGTLMMVGVAFAAAAPAAVWMAGRWGEAFAFRARVPWWIYPAAGAAVLLIAMATVSLQSWRAATANPVNSLKSE